MLISIIWLVVIANLQTMRIERDRERLEVHPQEGKKKVKSTENQEIDQHF